MKLWFRWFFFLSLVGVIGEPSPLNQTSWPCITQVAFLQLGLLHFELFRQVGGGTLRGHLITKPFFVLEGSCKVHVFCSGKPCVFGSPRLDIHVSLFSFWRSMNNCVRSVSFQILHDYLNPTVIGDRLEVQPPFVLGPKPPWFPYDTG